ncbi:hypothetical protein Tco_0035910, partial [Tanacetum coccineum]
DEGGGVGGGVGGDVVRGRDGGNDVDGDSGLAVVVDVVTRWQGVLVVVGSLARILAGKVMGAPDKW